MAQAGYDPREAIALWARMAAGQHGGAPESLSMHPSGTTRMRDYSNGCQRLCNITRAPDGARTGEGSGMRSVRQVWLWYVVSVVLLGVGCLVLWAQPASGGKLAIDHAPFTRPHRRGAPLTIDATITAPAGVRKAEVFCRTAGGGDFTAFEMEPVGNDAYRTVVPDWLTAGVGLEYYITATDARGQSTSQGFVGFPLLVRFVSGQAPTQEDRLKALQETLDDIRKSKETEGFQRQPQAPTNRPR